jgi:hypothetical protein
MFMMQPFILISILVFVLIVVSVLIVIVIATHKSEVDSIQSGQELHPRSYWIGLGISIGAGFGVTLGLIFDNLALSLAIGAAVGSGIGAILEHQNQDKTRPLTDQELKLQKRGIGPGLFVLLLIGGIFVLLLVTRSR